MDFLVGGYARGDIPDYQMAAFAMAVFFRGMTPEETAALTRVMLNSGESVDTSCIRRPKVDKHSTGGIGDKLSLPLAPLVASCGVAVPMISGRGLGITGGTLDKLESIPGYRTALDVREFLSILQSCGCSMIGQTERIVPADRKLYALRDVTATVPSIPLIVSSIMSKKLAEGIDGLVLDVKCGRGAFMKTREDARSLAGGLVNVGRAMGKRVTALVTAMDQPLGRTVGNSLEMVEAIDILRGNGPVDAAELTFTLAAEMLALAGVVSVAADARPLLRRKLESGAALETFKTMVRLHGGRPEFIDDPGRFPVAPLRHACRAPRAGTVRLVDAETVGRISLLLGAGRTTTADVIDPSAGLSELVKVGEQVEAGQPLAILHASSRDKLDAAMQLTDLAFDVGDVPAEGQGQVLERFSIDSPLLK